MNGALAVARYTLVELSRRRILLVFFIIGAVGLILLGAGLRVLYSFVSSSGSTGFGPENANPALYDRYVQLMFISYLYSALSTFALLIGYAIGMTAIYHDLDSGAAVSIFSKPITRFGFSVGKIAAAIASLVLIVGALAIEARLVMLLYPGGFEGSLTAQVVVTIANIVVVMLIVLALTAWMNNIVAVIVAFVYYNVVSNTIQALHTLADGGAITNRLLKGFFDVLYWLVPHPLVSSAPGDLLRAQLQMSGAPSNVQTAALIPPSSGAGDIAWWAFTVLVFGALVYYSVRRRQV